jgi:hypothetical protein
MPRHDADESWIEAQVGFLAALLDEGATLAGDVYELGVEVWAIHGRIPVDGEVIMAEFDTVELATSVLDRVWTRVATA